AAPEGQNPKRRDVQDLAEPSSLKKSYSPFHPVSTRINQRNASDTASIAGLTLPEASVHVLVTADTMSGSWIYNRELVTGLVTRGVRVTLVSFGEIPLPEQTAWMDHLHGLDYRPTAFRLEWMQQAEDDLLESSMFLAALVREIRPDVLHLNQFCYGDLPVDVPRVVMAHGDLLTWKEAGTNAGGI